jgi:hypothetical protein
MEVFIGIAKNLFLLSPKTIPNTGVKTKRSMGHGEAKKIMQY